jgi:predicted ArsR family transcriptional regulator
MSEGVRVDVVRERIVLYAAGGYRRRDIADLVGVSTEELRRHLVELGIVNEYPSVLRRRKNLCGVRHAHNGPEVFEEAEYE